MADDLLNLSELEPAATDQVASGDDEIRKTRLHVKNWADVEHHLTGEHQFEVGTAEPAAGKAGRLFFSTLYGCLLRDTGSAWTMVRTTGNSESEFALGSLALGTTFGTKVSEAVQIPPGAQLQISAQCQVDISTPGTTNQIDFRIILDGSAGLPNFVSQTVLVKAVMTTIIVFPTPGTGLKTVEFQVRKAEVGLVGTTSQHLLVVNLF